MSRVLVLPLVVALVGCSGGPVDTGSSDTRSRSNTGKDTAPRGGSPTDRAGPKSTSKDSPSEVRKPHTAEELQAQIADLGDPDDAKRVRAAKELQQWGKEAAPATHALATMVATGGAEPREAALAALEAIHPDHAADLRALVADADAARRAAAEKRLADLPAEALKSLLPIIDWRIAALPVEVSKPTVGFALAGEEYAALAPLLLKAGVDQDGFRAVVNCGKVSPEGGKALWERAQLTLCELAKQDSWRKDALKALESSLESRPSAATVKAVGELGPDAKSLAPLLQTLTTDRDPDVRKAAAEALKKVQG
jgi:hypothetical protein